jgi:ribosomal protein S18 acetylase RimI-like enzyme
MLETQDTNLAACRFYKKYGFILGGVDTMLYRNFENKDQKALFWYYPVDIKK